MNRALIFVFFLSACTRGPDTWTGIQRERATCDINGTRALCILDAQAYICVADWKQGGDWEMPHRVWQCTRARQSDLEATDR